MLRSKKTILLVYLLCFHSANASAKLKEFETTKVMQTSGAGVGSILINETTLLNPASITFINDSTIYYQKTSTEIEEKNTGRTERYKDGNALFVGFADTTTPLKGGFSYLYQNEHQGKRKRFALSSSGAVNKNTSLGFTYKYTDEMSDIIDDVYHQITVGLTHIQSETLSIGLVYVDPQNKISEYSHYTLGVQYVFNQFIHFLVDVGSGDMANPSRESFTKMAIQVNSFKYVFIRTGRFHDKFNNRKGYSYGISWVGPKFSLEYAYKNSVLISQSSEQLLLEDEQLIETSFAISALF